MGGALAQCVVPKAEGSRAWDLPPRLAQVCHHSRRQNSVSCCRMLGNTYRATAARAKNTRGFHIPNMFCGDQRQMVSAQASKPCPKPEIPCLPVLDAPRGHQGPRPLTSRRRCTLSPGTTLRVPPAATPVCGSTLRSGPQTTTWWQGERIGYCGQSRRAKGAFGKGSSTSLVSWRSSPESRGC